MQSNEAKSIALGSAANLLADGIATPKSLVSAAMSYLTGLTDKATFLKKCDKNLTYARLVMSSEQKLTDFDTDAMCALHKFLYEPKAKAGELRSEELTLPGGSCTDAKLLRGSLKNALLKLSEIQGAPDASKADFAASLSCYMRELIILSPFSYGNGIVRRAFIQSFCASRGFYLSYAAISKKELASAETQAFAADDPQPLFTALVKCLNYIVESTPAPKAKQHKLAAPRAPHTSTLSAKQAVRSAGEIAAAKTTESRRLATREKPDTKTEALMQLRDVQKALNALTQKVNDIIKNLEND